MTVLFEVSWPLQLKPKFEVLPLWYGFTWLCFRVAFLRINMERFCGDWAVGAAFGRRDPGVWKRYLGDSTLVGPGRPVTVTVEDDDGAVTVVRGTCIAARDTEHDEASDR